MFCIAALIVFSILSIFSATHRPLAKEAFDCVFRRITFRPCVSGFREKIQAKILAYTMTKSMRMAQFLNKYFELLAWIFFILMVGSTLWVARGFYNYYFYGSCQGLNVSGFCVFDPSGENNKVSDVAGECRTEAPSSANLTLEGVDLSLFPTKNTELKDTLVFIGCYSCEYTRKTYPIIQALLQKMPVHYIFAHFPVKKETKYLTAYGYCAYQQDPKKFWKLNDELFASRLEDLARPAYVDSLTAKVGLKPIEFKSCLRSERTKEEVAKRIVEIEQTGIYGTPLVFINGKGLVGPKPYRVYYRMLRPLFNLF